MLPLLALLAGADPAPLPKWEKVVLDAKFRSEGVAVADVNADGKPDVLTGEHWYAAPDWQRHPMQAEVDHKDGLNNYSRVFACWADDFSGDGRPDLLVIDFPGVPCYWLEHPGADLAAGKPWRRHQVWHSACNETPLYTDLLGTGKRVLVMGFQPKDGKQDGNAGQMAYFTPGKDCYAAWDMHPVSAPSEPGRPVPGTARFAHGLGAGDVNGDGKQDVITTGGWWEQPASTDGKSPWTFHPAALGDASADMLAYDVDGDGKADIVSSSAHQFGIRYFTRSDKAAPDAFTKVDLFPRLVSETHALHLVDLDGDGQLDLVTGKRWWSHGRSEPGSAWPAKLVWLRGVKEPDGITSFTPHVLDADSGVGTQFTVTDVDLDGKLDVVTSNKKGVRVVFQRAASK